MEDSAFFHMPTSSYASTYLASQFSSPSVFFYAAFSALVIINSRYQSVQENAEEAVPPAVSNIQPKLNFTCKNKEHPNCMKIFFFFSK